MLRPHMRKGVLDAVHKFGEKRHTLRLRLAVHPRLQTLAQQAEMVFIEFWRVGFGQRLGVDGMDHRVAVIFVQARPHQRLKLWRLQTFLNAFKGLPMALQTAHQHRLKLQAALTKIHAQTLALLVTQRRKIVVVVGTKRGLAVAH